MQNSIQNRLKFLIENLKISYSEFARRVDIPYRTIQDYISGNRIPGGENLQKIATQLRVNLNWLLTGEGEMFMKKESEPVVKPEGEQIGKDFVLIPLVSGRISAGKGLTPIDDAEIELKLAFRLDWIKRRGDHRKMSLIRVEGDSMEPTLSSGDIVLVDGNRNYIDLHGGIYAILVNDSIMIKRIQLLFNEKKLKIISDNPKYEPIIINPDDIHVIGKVIWIGREIER